MMALHFKENRQRKFLITLSISYLLLPFIVYADCSMHPVGAPRVFCEALNGIEAGHKDCKKASEHHLPQDLKSPRAPLDSFNPVCEALTELSQGGDCLRFQNNSDKNLFVLCTGLLAGFNKSCNTDNWRDFALFSPACKIGEYIAATRPLFLKKRLEGIFSTKLASSPHATIPSEKPCSTSSPPLINNNAINNICAAVGCATVPSANEERINTMAARLLAVYHQNNFHIPSGVVRDHLKKVDEFLEKNKTLLLEKAKGRSLYFREGDSIAPEGLEPPAALEVFPDGRIIVHLKRIPQESGDPIEVPPIGVGGFKRVYLGLNYTEGALWASSWARDLKNKEIIRDMKNESHLQGSVLGRENPSTARTPLTTGTDYQHKGREGHIIGQPYYPLDLKTFLERYLQGSSQKYQEFEGHDLQTISIQIVEDLLEGLVQIHEKKIHHRDLKPENIFLSLEERALPRAKISDFGLALDTQHLSGEPIPKGSPIAMAPDYVRAFQEGSKDLSLTDRNFKNDVWAAGLIVYAITNDLPEIHGESPSEIFTNLITLKEYKDFQERSDISFEDAPKDSLAGLAKEMLNPDHSKRFDAKDALARFKQIKEIRSKAAPQRSAAALQIDQSVDSISKHPTPLKELPPGFVEWTKRQVTIEQFGLK